MTNEQLALLVRAWADRLDTELDLLRQRLPESLERYETEVYTGGATGTLRWFDRNPDHWRKEKGDFVVLEGLQSFLEDLYQAEAADEAVS